MDDDFRKAALDYHRLPRPGKLSITPTKRMETQRDLGLAYSPGVAAACEAIAADPRAAFDYTARGNLVAVITNGTAVLGLGSIGALASKPVMEGKAVLFQKFAGIDSIDIEIDEKDPDKLIEVIAALEPSFGAINLEDIKAPECFEVERRLRERMRIPVFHDDQHGTAIIVAAAVRNALLLQGKRLEDVRLVNTGGGAAALACLDLLVAMGLKRENVTICDIGGVVHMGDRDQCAELGRCATGRGRVSGPFRTARPEAGMAETAGTQPPCVGAGQSRARNPARSGARRAPGCDCGDGTDGLSEPGQ
jgi:malate dehydrogenase (oxaloacetate-decarboxylating)(NADP+)